MKSEADFKKHFKASVRAQGGFSISLAAPMMPGLPDIYCVMPGFAPVLLEAKWLKEVPDKFKRTLRFTEMQKMYLRSCNKVLKGSAHGLVGLKWKGKIWALIVDTNTILTHDHINEHCACISKQSEYFMVKEFFYLNGVPKMNLTYTPTCGSVSIETQIGDIGADTTRDLAI